MSVSSSRRRETKPSTGPHARRFEVREVAREVEDFLKKELRRRSASASPPYLFRPWKVRSMSRSESKTEGFAYYVDDTIYLNRCVYSLPRRDWYILFLHEFCHHIQGGTQLKMGLSICTDARCSGAEERCATTCELRWAKKMGYGTTGEEWKTYSSARADLDEEMGRRRERTGKEMTVSEVKTFLLKKGVPPRLVRPSVERRRVIESPGEVVYYVRGVSASESKYCPCGP